MSLSAGIRLGTFEILAPLGAGGMGEVYRARDTKLGREVAIKVLPQAVSQDPEKLARFGREAHLLASLNHPNIATLYGLEESDGQQFLVMELVEGDTLADRLLSGPMPVDEALPLFVHVAEGREAAHEKGIVHRDLKPANIKITKEGKPKILDFGLAKASAGDAVVLDLSQSPTLTRDATATGVLLGTAPYMSPEQARGKRVDKRTDIWAFGCVLYEALTGRAAFLGETVSDTIAKILEAEPDWEVLPANTPFLIRSLLRRCLRKDPARRQHDMADARIEIDEAREEPWRPGSIREPSRSALLKGVTPWLLLAITASLAVWSVLRPTPEPRGEVTRFNIGFTREEAFAPTAAGPSLAFSPDGRRIAYVVESDQRRLYLRDLGRAGATPIAGTEDAQSPFFSPDGQWIGFQAGNEIKKVGGGAPVTLCRLEENIRVVTWGPDDMVYFGSASSQLWRISSNGGEPEAVTTLDDQRGEWTHRYPEVLPGGEAVLFTIGDQDPGNWDTAKIAVVSLRTGERRTLIEEGSFGRYASSNDLCERRHLTGSALRSGATGSDGPTGARPRGRFVVSNFGLGRVHPFSRRVASLRTRRCFRRRAEIIGVGGSQREGDSNNRRPSRLSISQRVSGWARIVGYDPTARHERPLDVRDGSGKPDPTHPHAGGRGLVHLDAGRRATDL